MNRAIRSAVIAYLKDHPESHLNDIAAGVNKPVAAVRKCILGMEYKKDVISTRIKHTSTAGPPHKVWSINPDGLDHVVLSETEQRKVDLIEYLGKHPESSVRGICRGMHLSKGKVQYTVNELRKDMTIWFEEELITKKGTEVVKHLWYVYDGRLGE